VVTFIVLHIEFERFYTDGQAYKVLLSALIDRDRRNYGGAKPEEREFIHTLAGPYSYPYLPLTLMQPRIYYNVDPPQ
jgi:hypothetical protein